MRLSAYDPLADGEPDVQLIAEGYALYARFRFGDVNGAEASLERLRRLSQRQFVPAAAFVLPKPDADSFVKRLRTCNAARKTASGGTRNRRWIRFSTTCERFRSEYGVRKCVVLVLATALMEATPSPPPQIYRVVTTPFCARIHDKVRPAVSAILQNDAAIAKSVPLFKDYGVGAFGSIERAFSDRDPTVRKRLD